MNSLKRNLIIGAGVASIGIAGITGVATASALTSTDSTTGTSLIDKLVSKFNLNKDEVQAVFDADRSEHHAAMQAERTAALKTALTDGKLTQAQYDYIVAAQAEIDTLMDTAGAPDTQSDETRAAIKAKLDTLRDWMKEQNLTLENLGLGFGRGGHGPGRGDHDKTNE